MTAIRPGRDDDLFALIRMGRSFFAAAAVSEVTTFDPASFGAVAHGLITGEIAGALLVAEHDGKPVGMAAFVTFPLYFNVGATMAQEVFWWVEPEHRSGVGARLLEAMEEAARAGGAAALMVGAIAGLRDTALAEFYRRRGYRAAENTFVRTLER